MSVEFSAEVPRIQQTVSILFIIAITRELSPEKAELIMSAELSVSFGAAILTSASTRAL